MVTGVKTICQECGEPNELGHVFCTKCSARLDLQTVDDDIEHTQSVNRRKKFFRGLLLVIIIIVVVSLALGLWPSTAPLTREGAKEGNANSIRSQITQLHDMSQMRVNDRHLSHTLKEEDLNAWLDSMKGNFRARSVSIRVDEDTLRLRAVQELRLSGDSSKVRLPAIPYSYEVVIRPEGTNMTVTSAMFGHLPLFGPTTELATGRFNSLFSKRTRERQVRANITHTKLEDGKATITVRSKGK
jgi:hypothetical protein